MATRHRQARGQHDGLMHTGIHRSLLPLLCNALKQHTHTPVASKAPPFTHTTPQQHVPA